MLCLGLTPPCARAAQPAQPPSSGHNITPVTPEEAEQSHQRFLLMQAADRSLHAREYAKAEEQARQALTMDGGGDCELTLVEAVKAQGRFEEALKICEETFLSKSHRPKYALPYAALLLKAGRWEKAVEVYHGALPYLDDGDILRANSHFSAAHPEPVLLATAIHLAQALTDRSRCNLAQQMLDEEAFDELRQAITLSPDSDLANSYYNEAVKKRERAKAWSASQAASASGDQPAAKPKP